MGDRLKFVILGIGINVNFKVRKVFPKELQESVASLRDVLGGKVKLEKLFRKLLENLEFLYDVFLKKGFVQILEEWKKFACFLGCPVEVLVDGQKWIGTVLDVEEDGALRLKLEDGTVKRFLYGDVTLRFG
jgi:BirA family biotin operon repressor/biotin-[acetyl-CoA-carboxylase] ligase